MNITLSKTTLRPNMTAIDGYLLLLCNLFESIDVHRHETLTSTDPQALHELRIAIRKARSVLREGRKVLPLEIFDAMSQDLSWLSCITSDARDLDTLVNHWPQYERLVESRIVSHLQPIVREISHRQNVTYQDMRAQLNGQRVVAMINEWQVFMIDGTDIGEGGELAHEPLKNVVSSQISRAHKKFINDCRAINGKSSDDDVHELRKDAKRIRYLTESFSEVLSPKNEKVILTQLLSLQDNLGEVQDLRIHEQIVIDVNSYLRPMYAESTIRASEELLIR